jgi:CrcB protein
VGEERLNTALIDVALVGAGGFFGAVLRFGLGGLVHRRLPLGTFPYGTMVVNLVGCFLIGLAAGFAEVGRSLGPEFGTFALIGLLGGFTTFSTFGYETMALLRDGEIRRAALNVAANVVLGLGLVWVGYALAS